MKIRGSNENGLRRRESTVARGMDVQNRVVCVRQETVILDADVAELYGVETKRVNEAVRNNPDKFPPDYMFVLAKEDLIDLRSKNSSTKLSTNSRALPYLASGL